VCVKIIIDNREQEKSVEDELRSLGCGIEIKFLPTGDYVLGNIGVERKSVADFFSSLETGRIWEQIKSLSESYEKPVLIIEGYMHMGWKSNTIESVGKIYNWNPAAVECIMLAMSRIVYVRQTDGPEHTANLLYCFAKHEQEKRRRSPLIKYKPRATTMREKQLRVLQSFPGISGEMSSRIVDEFPNLKTFFTSNQDGMQNIKGMGEKKTQEILDVINNAFEKNPKNRGK